MIPLRLAHVAARGGHIDGHALRRECRDQSLDRCLAAEIHHRASPIENDQIEFIFQTHAVPSLPKRLSINSSPMAKPVEAPAPQVTIATRTDGSGASINTGRSAAEA